QVARRADRCGALSRSDRAVDFAAVREQAADHPATHEAVGPGDEHFHDTRSRSASTIMRTRSVKLVCGAQPRSRLALDGSACNKSTSAGRTNRGSTFTCRFQSRPACENATSHSSRTEWVSPVPTTYT